MQRSQKAAWSTAPAKSPSSVWLPLGSGSMSFPGFSKHKQGAHATKRPACHPQPDTQAFLCIHSVLRGLFLTDLCRDRELRARDLSSLAPHTVQGDTANLCTIGVCKRHGAPGPGTVKNWTPGPAGLRNGDPLEACTWTAASAFCFEGVSVERTFASVRVTQCVLSRVPAGARRHTRDAGPSCPRLGGPLP